MFKNRLALSKFTLSLSNVSKGFTLVELLLVIGIFAILATFSSLNLFSTYSSSNLGAAKDVLIADLKSIQSSAMSGEGQDGTATLGWGLIVNDSSTYTQFPGTVYDPGSSKNFRTTLPSDITIATSFASSTIIFGHASGEVANFASNQDTFTLSSPNEAVMVRLNQYGTIIGDQ